VQTSPRKENIFCMYIYQRPLRFFRRVQHLNLYVWQDLFICVIQLNHMCNINMCDMTQHLNGNLTRSCVRHDTTRFCRSHRASFDEFSTWITMGWLRLVGSLKLQVSFSKYSFFYKALLKKRPTILRSLLIVATPYVWHDCSFVCHNSIICATWLAYMCDMTLHLNGNITLLSKSSAPEFVCVTW